MASLAPAPRATTATLCEIDIDDCAGDPCLNGGTCADGVNGFSCNCAPGYDGDTCEIDIDECAGDPCKNGGICTDAVDDFSCDCPTGYDGKDCSGNPDDCAQ